MSWNEAVIETVSKSTSPLLVNVTSYSAVPFTDANEYSLYKPSNEVSREASALADGVKAKADATIIKIATNDKICLRLLCI